jgi:hypothetical protein
LSRLKKNRGQADMIRKLRFEKDVQVDEMAGRFRKFIEINRKTG